VFLVVSTKNLKLLTVPSARKIPLTLGEAISLPELHLPSCGRIIPYVDAKYSTLETRELCFQASVFLTSSNKQTKTLAGRGSK
jgi:hypothetical protein